MRREGGLKLLFANVAFSVIGSMNAVLSISEQWELNSLGGVLSFMGAKEFMSVLIELCVIVSGV
jgi:hypothetical protein